jgi:hypothetical protein
LKATSKGQAHIFLCQSLDVSHVCFPSCEKNSAVVILVEQALVYHEGRFLSSISLHGSCIRRDSKTSEFASLFCNFLQTWRKCWSYCHVGFGLRTSLYYLNDTSCLVNGRLGL